jgi:hypothetical protein
MGTRRLSTTLPPMLLALAVAAAFTAAMLTTGVARAAVFAMTADLTAAAEVPNPGPQGATGSAVIIIDDETNEVCFELTIDGLGKGDSVIAAHIHEGAAGVAGDVVVPLFTSPPTGEMTGCVQDVDPSVIAAITADPDGHYVNIHTELFPDGAVRGQLVVSSVGGGCTITLTPSTIADGGQFTVSGNFGNAEIHVVAGSGTNVPEDSEPIATVPVTQSSFNVTITMLPGSVGTWTVWAFIDGSECGDSAVLTVTAGTLPDTAAMTDGAPAIVAIGALLLALGALTFRRMTLAPMR